MAARSKLTDAFIEQFCDLLSKGHYRVTAASLCGVHWVTVSKWMAAKREPYLSFQAAVLAAEARAEDTQLTKIIESPEPADARWYLARKHPDRWAETKRVDVTGRLDLQQRVSVPANEQNPGLLDAIITLASYVSADSGSEPGTDGDGDNAESL